MCGRLRVQIHISVVYNQSCSCIQPSEPSCQLAAWAPSTVGRRPLQLPSAWTFLLAPAMPGARAPRAFCWGLAFSWHCCARYEVVCVLVLQMPLAAAVNSPVCPREGPLSEDSDSPRADPDLTWFLWLLLPKALARLRRPKPECIVVKHVKRYIAFLG